MSEIFLKKNQAIHIIGGGGVGMSAISLLLIDSGYRVSASDKNGGKYLEKLTENGAVTWVGSAPQKIPTDATIFYSSAVPEDDLERVWAVEQKMEIHSRHSLLKSLSSQYYTIAISGTHGKTTTTGWIAYLLETEGFDPNALVGGTLIQWKSNIRLGKGQIDHKPILVIEADESDGSFLDLVTREIIITNVELDHVDHYHDLIQVQEKFKKFISNCEQNDGIFFPSFEVQKLLNPEMSSFEIISSIASRIKIDEENQALKLAVDGEEIIFKIGLSGLHNLWNAFAVLTFALYHSISFEAIEQSLFEFAGTERRMQKLYEYKNSNSALITIMDDYAHHPTEVKMVLETLLKTKKNLVVVWEPHRISRLLHFNEDFKRVFEKTVGYQNMFLMNVYDAAGEKNKPEFTNFDNVWHNWIKTAKGIISQKNEFSHLHHLVQKHMEDTILVFLGAGYSSEFAQSFVESLKNEQTM